MGAIRLFSSIGLLDLNGIQFSEGQRTKIITHMLKKDWNTFTNINNYSILNCEHNWEDMCIKSYIKKSTNMHF